MASQPAEIEERPIGYVTGRPTDYRPVYAEQARKLAQAGWTDQQMADFFEISKVSFYAWQAEHPEFLNSIALGKDAPDDRVVRTLYHRAVGYDYEEEQAIKVKVGKDLEQVEIVTVTKHIPGDVTAQSLWLRNRRKKEWRDKHDIGLHDDREPQQFDIRRLPVELREQFRAMMLLMLPPEQRALMAPEVEDAEFEHVEEGDG